MVSENRRATGVRGVRRMVLGAAALVVAGLGLPAAGEDPNKWPVHDLTRPAPAAIEPGTAGTQEQPGRPPSDAVVLFDGKDLSKWVASKDKAPAPWKVANGAFEVVKGTGGIETNDSFGDCQLHIEWTAPSPAVGEGQGRGNSGVFFGGGRYEVQVLDSYQSKTYPDGQASALYGQYPPIVNATRPPGQWQTTTSSTWVPASTRTARTARSRGRPGSPFS